MKRLISLFFAFSLAFLCSFTLVGVSTVHATDLDTVGNSGTTNNGSQNGNSGTGDQAADSITGYMKGYNAVDNEDMAKANKLASPITNIIGTLIGVIVVLTTAGIFLITALDLMYIAIPFVRPTLNPNQGASAGGGGMGMGMGMGMSGMGGMQGGQQQGGQRCWVSDEAIASIQPQGGAAGAGGMGGMGMGGMGMGMGGMGGMQGGQAPTTKSAIGTYLKKRMFFLIVFGVASILLLSSLFLDCGINLAQLLYKVGTIFNDGIANTSV